MKAKIKMSRTVTAVSILLAVVVLCLATYGVTAAKRNSRLSEAQIEALRGEYPVYGNINLVRGCVSGHFTLEEVQEIADSFVYGTIEGEMTTYDKYISTGDQDVDEKRESMGLGNSYPFFKYTLSVIEDASGTLQKGDKIELTANMDFINFYPPLTDRMKIVTPIMIEKTGQYSFNACGMYYVTEDGYAISAFDEAEAEIEEPLSGMRVERLLDELKK